MATTIPTTLAELPAWVVYVARDSEEAGGMLFGYQNIPKKDSEGLEWISNTGSFVIISEVEETEPELKQLTWEQGPVPVDNLRRAEERKASVAAVSDVITKSLASATHSYYSAIEGYIQTFLDSHPELTVSEIYLDYPEEHAKLLDTEDGYYKIEYPMPTIKVKPRHTVEYGKIEDEQIQSMLQLYKGLDVKITIEVIR